MQFYSDPHQSRPMSLLIASVTLSLAVLCLLTLPLDIYNVSSSSPPSVIASHAQVVRVVLYLNFGLLLLFAFFFVPFTLFYYEVGVGDDTMTVGQRICASCKYTTAIVCILIVLIILGLLIEPGKKRNSDIWYHKLMSSVDNIDRCISFIMGCMGVAGLVAWLTYTAVGLAIIPIQLLFVADNTEITMSAKQEISTDLAMTKEKIRVIEVKYQLSGRPIEKKDKRELEEMRERTQLLSSRLTNLEAQRESCLTKLCRLLAPIRVLIGVILGLTSLIIVISFSIAGFDRFTHSHCHAECGFSVDKPLYFNPADKAFVVASRIFPLDYVGLSCLVVYLVVATLEGISALGLRFFWAHLFTFKRRATDPTAVLVGVTIIASMILTVTIEISAMLPQYATFGSKHVKGQECSLGRRGCQMSEISQFVHRVMSFPFFAMIFFYATGMFVAVFLVALVVVVIRRPQFEHVHPESPADSL